MSAADRDTLEDCLNCIAFCCIESSSVEFFSSEHDCRVDVSEVGWV